VGLIATLTTVACIIAADTGAYFVGKNLGRTKLTDISPKKTVEGALGGLASAVAVAVLFWKLFSWPGNVLAAAGYGVSNWFVGDCYFASRDTTLQRADVAITCVSAGGSGATGAFTFVCRVVTMLSAALGRTQAPHMAPCATAISAVTTHDNVAASAAARYTSPQTEREQAHAYVLLAGADLYQQFVRRPHRVDHETGRWTEGKFDPVGRHLSLQQLLHCCKLDQAASILAFFCIFFVGNRTSQAVPLPKLAN
jgi:hypothetical protein